MGLGFRVDVLASIRMETGGANYGRAGQGLEEQRGLRMGGHKTQPLVRAGLNCLIDCKGKLRAAGHALLASIRMERGMGG